MDGFIHLLNLVEPTLPFFGPTLTVTGSSNTPNVLGLTFALHDQRSRLTPSGCIHLNLLMLYVDSSRFNSELIIQYNDLGGGGVGGG